MMTWDASAFPSSRWRDNLRQAARRTSAYLHAAYIDLRLFVTRKADPELPPLRLRFVGVGDFREVGEELAAILRAQGLQPHDRVLDIGCGAGRVALPLARYIAPPGTYDGFDVVGRAISWCRRNISRRHPNFRFHHVRLRNTAYSIFGRAASSLTFPNDDASVDVAFAFSVFTHLTLPEIRRYLHEAHRVLAPGGRLVATFFILNDESLESLSHIHLTYRFPVVGDGVRYANAANPGAGVAVEEPILREMLAGAGFGDYVIHRGRWAARPEGITFQDLIVATR